MKQQKIIVISCIAISLIIIAGFVYTSSKPGNLDSFAACLKEKKAVFYGAFWCSHCQNQKKMFGNSMNFLPYVECSTADGKEQLKICQDKKISSYPTWEFSDGSRLTGEVALEKLAEKTSCALPK